MVWVLLHAKGEAKKKGLIQPKAPSGRTFMQSVSHYAVEFDSKSAHTVFNNLQRQPSADGYEQSSVPSF
jgi:hypothetical protein